MNEPFWLWIAFNAAVIFFLALDLGVFNRHAHIIRSKEALGWSIAWITLSLLFNLYIYLTLGREKAIDFLAGYLIEKSLSVDNIFIFVLIFSFFKVPAKLQHKILFWGVVGALLLRGGLIGIGAYLISNFHWVIYIFGAFLLYTGIKILVQRDQEAVDVADNPVVKIFRKFIPVTNDYDGEKFLTVVNGRRMATPMLLVLVVVEFTDLVFAVDSIPAIFAVTEDPFIVYTSNVCAILGLRALYFLLANLVKKFRYLQPALGLILTFVGVKMLLSSTQYKISSTSSLLIIVGILVIAIIASAIKSKDSGPKEG